MTGLIVRLFYHRSHSHRMDAQPPYLVQVQLNRGYRAKLKWLTVETFDNRRFAMSQLAILKQQYPNNNYRLI